MKLTARQIQYMDEFNADKAANDHTLAIALQFHSNNTNEIAKSEKGFWEELSELHDLDRSKRWSVKKIDGAIMIVEEDDA